MIVETGDKKSKLRNAISESLAEINRESNVRYINPESYEKLGSYHKNLLYNFGQMFGLVSKNQDIDYTEFTQVMQKLFELKTDTEKQYLW